MVNSKVKGTNFERIVKKCMIKLNGNSEIFRSPASLGSADLICIDRNGDEEIGSVVLLIQCKYLRKYLSNKEKEKLIEDSKRIGAYAYLAYREKPRGKIFLDQLWPVVIQRISLKRN